MIKIPVITVRWRYLDFRRWYYVWIENEKCDWWALDYELEELKERYSDSDIKFSKIPWWKTIVH